MQIWRALGLQEIPRQMEILADDRQVVVVMSGRRFGKTQLATVRAIARLLFCPGAVVMGFAPRERQARNLFQRILQGVDELGPRYGVDYAQRDTYGKWAILTNGAVLLTGATEIDPDQFRGWPIDLAVLDEAAYIWDVVWTEVVVPAMSERQGQAFLISTPFENSWFNTVYDRYMMALQREGVLKGLTGEELDKWIEEQRQWSFYRCPSWENTAVYPLGAQDPKVIEARRSMGDPRKFVVEMAAVPLPPRERVFPEFVPEVHVRSCPVNPKHPISLAIDPAVQNIYAVLAIQDYGEVVCVVDELAEQAIKTEEVIDFLATKPWWGQVQRAVIDPDAEETRRRWIHHPRVHFPVHKFKRKPQVMQRNELVRRWLFDPLLYADLAQELREQVLKDLGWGKRWEELSPEDKMEVETYVEERMRTREMLPRLREMARLFVDPRCTRLIEEMRRQYFKRPREPQGNLPQRPVDAWNDCTDALGYYFWLFKRYDTYSLAHPSLEEEAEGRKPLTPGQFLIRMVYGDKLAGVA